MPVARPVVACDGHRVNQRDTMGGGRLSLERTAGRSRRQDLRALATPLTISLAIHVAALGGFALFSGPSRISPALTDAAMRATITRTAETLVTPAVESPPPALSKSSVERLPKPAFLPVPMRPQPLAPQPPSSEGRVTIEVQPTAEPIDPSVESVIATLYPGAARGEPEFDILPTNLYPEAALADKRQVQIQAVAIVLDDGRVELAEGTQNDALFTPAVRATLAAAKARPSLDADGKPRTTYVLLMFTFEVVGGP